LVALEILYVVVFMRAGREDTTSFDHFVAYLFFGLWIIVPLVGIFSGLRFLSVRTSGRGFRRSVIGLLLSFLFLAIMAYAYVTQ
jgi:hypothetical protein